MLTLDDANGKHEFGSNLEDRCYLTRSYVNPAMINYRLLTLAAKTKLLNTLSETTLFTEPNIEAMEICAEAKARYKYSGDTPMYEKYHKEYKKSNGWSTCIYASVHSCVYLLRGYYRTGNYSRQFINGNSRCKLYTW
jgi:hypothetical protein